MPSGLQVCAPRGRLPEGVAQGQFAVEPGMHLGMNAGAGDGGEMGQRQASKVPSPRQVCEPKVSVDDEGQGQFTTDPGMHFGTGSPLQAPNATRARDRSRERTT